MRQIQGQLSLFPEHHTIDTINLPDDYECEGQLSIEDCFPNLTQNKERSRDLTGQELQFAPKGDGI